jgi:hypothetical protein
VLRDGSGRRPTDVGGNLLRVLELTKTPWIDILRTNRMLMDPFFFAIYGNVIYHHGAGFRRGGPSRAHYDSRPKPLPVAGAPHLRHLVERIEAIRLLRWRIRTRAPQILESKRVFEKIKRDDPDWVADIS